MFKSEKGQAIAELAIVGALLALLLLAVADFGRLFSAYVIITNAANSGAVYGSASMNAAQDSAGIAAAARNETSTLIQDPNDQLTISSAVQEDSFGQHNVRVTVTFRPNFQFPIPGVLNHVTLQRSVVRMVQE